MELHGNAFNPDAGNLAQHSQCSEGHLWQHRNSHEIGCSAQGLGKIDPSIKGTNTAFFIDHKKVLKGRKVTCLDVISACRPKKKDPHPVRWTRGSDQVDPLAMLALKLPISLRPKSSSPVSCPLQEVLTSKTFTSGLQWNDMSVRAFQRT